MTLWHVYANDAYELTLSSDNTLLDIVRYRNKRTTVGESLSFDQLESPLQEELTIKINSYILNNGQNRP